MLSSLIDPQHAAQAERSDPSYPPQRNTSSSGERRVPGPGTHHSMIHAPAEGWFAIVLLAIALYCVVYSIIIAGWVSGEGKWLLISPGVGLLVGCIIAKIPRFPQVILHLGACLIGYWLAIWLTSAFAFHTPWELLLASLRAAFSGQLNGQLSQVPGVPDESKAVFFFYLTFLSFFLGYFGSWLIYHARLPWLVALVYSSIMFVNLYYIKVDLSYLAAIMFGALILLIARLQLVSQISTWTSEGLHTDRTWLRTINRRCMQVACGITIFVILVGWILPTQGQSTDGKAFWNQLGNVWNNVLSGHFSGQYPASLAGGSSSANFFGDHLAITGSVQLPGGEVLYYKSSDGQSHYLEGFTYNQFDGHTWTTSLLPGNGGTLFGANRILPRDTGSSGSGSLQTTVTMVMPPGGSKSYLFAPAVPTSFSVGTVLYNDGTTGAWTQLDPLTVNENYSVSSLLQTEDAHTLSDVALPAADPGQWRADQYYGRFSADYLSFPGDLSPTVQQTLKSWTVGATDAYAAMQKLQSHLSDDTQFKYSLSNPDVPANMDVVDWLLQNRVGYCTHYATTMAVMGRMLDIPTRIVAGFSQGHYDAQRQVWIVNGTDAHSWVQAYFPGHGWINFDPTPGFSLSSVQPGQKNTQSPGVPTPVAQPTKLPAKNSAATAQPTHEPITISQPAKQANAAKVVGTNQALWITVVVVILLLALLFLGGAGVLRWWRHMYAHSSPVAGTFWRVCRVASWLGLAPEKWQTPYEYSQVLGRQIPQRATPLWRLTELFVHERWGPPRNPLQEQENVAIARLWPDLRALLVNLFLNKLRRKSVRTRSPGQ